MSQNITCRENLAFSVFEENVFIFQFLNDKIHNYGFLEQISLKNYYQKGKKRSNLVSLLKLIGLQIPHTS